MGEKMTLEQVRDILRKYAQWGAVKIDASQMSIGCSQCAGAIDAHLTTPAQTVDVEAVREVIASHREEIRLCNKYDQESIDYLTEQADKLSQSIGDKT